MESKQKKQLYMNLEMEGEWDKDKDRVVFCGVFSFFFIHFNLLNN